MAVAKSASATLEDRLALISQMLEEAVSLLRNTMSEVKTEVKNDEEGARRHDDPEGKHRPR